MPAKYPKVGEMRHLVRIQRNEGTINTSGNRVDAWKDRHAIRAAIVPRKGDLRFVGEKLVAVSTHTIHIRFIKGILPSDRIAFNDRGTERLFQIRSITNREERGFWLDFLVREGNDG